MGKPSDRRCQQRSFPAGRRVDARAGDQNGCRPASVGAHLHWYDSYLSYAVENGIIEEDYAAYTAAQLNTPISRGEFVHIFHGAQSVYAVINSIADNAIPDVNTKDPFAAEIYAFYRAGILTGSDAKGTFHSERSISRAEVAAILVRMYDSDARLSFSLV